MFWLRGEEHRGAAASKSVSTTRLVETWQEDQPGTQAHSCEGLQKPPWTEGAQQQKAAWHSKGGKQSKTGNRVHPFTNLFCPLWAFCVHLPQELVLAQPDSKPRKLPGRSSPARDQPVGSKEGMRAGAPRHERRLSWGAAPLGMCKYLECQGGSPAGDLDRPGLPVLLQLLGVVEGGEVRCMVSSIVR